MEHLRISVDIAGLWLRRRPEEKLDKEFTYAKLVELARKGDVAETRRIFDTPYARPTPTKIPAGHLFLDGLPQGSYQASLDLGTALAFFSQKGTTILCAFLCMGRPVGVLMLPEAYRDAELTVERPSFGNGTQAAEAGNSVSPGSLQQLALPDAIPETEDGMIGFSQKVDDRTAYSLLCKKIGTTLYYTAVQAENVEKASQLAKLELCAAEDMGAEKLLQQHKRWWQQYWGKSSLQLPDETLEQLWYRANYFLAAGSEPGNAPMPLQGVWCADDDQLPPWKGDYHNDLNTQFTYCHYLTANHPEQGKVFLDYLWSLRPQAAKFARAFYGTAGECLPSVMDIDGGALGGWPMYSLSPTNQIWLCQMFYEYYRLTGDKEFLRTRVEPYFTATAACLEELLHEGPDGKLVLPVSSSPEIHDDEAASWLTPNSNYDLALLHYLFQTLVQIEYQLGKSRSHWRAMDAKLAPLSVDAKTGLMLSPDETLQETHRHFSHAMAIEPLCMLRYENPQDRSVIDATVDHLVHLGSGQWVGFSFGWMALLQITRNNGKGALYELHRFAEHFLSRNGFHLNGDYKNSGVCDFHYRPFTLEADFLAAHAVQKMLLRSEKNHIEVLPACPQGWKNEPVAFQNLRAENGLLISYQRTADGKHSLTVKSNTGRKLVSLQHALLCHLAGRTNSILPMDGGKQEMNTKGRVTIPTDMDAVPETLDLLKRWGADAIRDCDGTEFPQELKDTGAKIYATYYTTRKDNAWAKANPDETQQCYIMTPFYTAADGALTIPLMTGISRELMKVNDHDDIARWWEVIDRTTGEPLDAARVAL